MAFFTVIIATRNRPALFRTALDSVLCQSWSDIEVIVVDDGSSPEYANEYRSILAGVDPPRQVRLLALAFRPKGHGAAYARNMGAEAARAPYLCFLDDDDVWTDPRHLSRAHDILNNPAAPVDVYMANQAAFLEGVQQPGPIWIEDLLPILGNAGSSPDDRGAYAVTVDTLLQSRGFCHLNTLIVLRSLYMKIGGMEETIRWEEDRDLYLRLIDRATVIRYHPITVARHNIPDPARTTNVTTAISELERRLFQIRLLDRAALFARHPAIRAYAKQNKVFTLKRTAEFLPSEGRHDEAAFYAREALGAGPTVKWAGYTFWRMLRAIVSRTSPYPGSSRGDS